MPVESSDAQSKLQRKRERDRRAQRLARERSKARVASLESLVQEIVQNDTSGSNALLVQEMAAIRAERDQYAKALECIARVAAAQEKSSVNVSHSASNLSDALLLDRPTVRRPAAKISPQDQAERDTIGAGETDAQGRPNEFVPPFDDSATPTGSVEAGEQQIGTTVSNIYTPESMLSGAVALVTTTCECYSDSSPPKYTSQSRWRRANESLKKSESIKFQEDYSASEMDEDIPVRAVLEGWQSVMDFWRLTELPEAWQILRGLDEAIFAQETGAVERIASYRICHRRIMSLCNPLAQNKASLPSWYLPRPSQDLPHSSAIDFVPWPGARERYVIHEHRYCSNAYWRAFASNMRVLWPFSERDCYLTSGDTYQISPYFDECLGDIKRWTLASDFFILYPELLGDIPKYNDAPRATSTRTQSQLARRADREESLEKSILTCGQYPTSERSEDDRTLHSDECDDMDWEQLIMSINWGPRAV